MLVDLTIYILNGILLVKVRTQPKLSSISNEEEERRRERQKAITKTVLLVAGVHLVLTTLPFVPSLYIMLSGGMCCVVHKQRETK